MTQAEIKKYEKINLKLQREKNRQTETIKQLREELERVKDQHSQKLIGAINS